MSVDKHRFRYTGNCVGWPSRDVDCEGGLSDMIDGGREIKRRTFLQHVDRDDLRQLAAECGYVDHPSRGLTMAGDYHVTYYRGRLHGQRVYWFRWSATEYVFENRGSRWTESSEKKPAVAGVRQETVYGL